MSYSRKLAAGQLCQVHIYDVTSGLDRVVYSTNETLFEAPNWTKADDLILNGDGLLWRLPVKGSGSPEHIAITGIGELNNDHVLAPDHDSVFLSANDDWHIYRAPISGGPASRVTVNRPGKMHFLHGVNPDGNELAYVQLDGDSSDVFSSGRIHIQNIHTGEDRSLVNGSGPEDGCEYSVDGDWIYFNSENFSAEPGAAQIVRAKRDGKRFEQLTFDDRVNWFPHTSPDGSLWVYLSYPPGTEGHPADLNVELRLVRDNAWQKAECVAMFFGGQGTINVNSWSPDSNRFAYVSYPMGI
jgi:hypothetical protein